MKYYFSINLSSSQYLPYYQGQVQAIAVTTYDGIKIQFPAMHLRKFVNSIGVYGEFCMETKNKKFLSLTKISYAEGRKRHE